MDRPGWRFIGERGDGIGDPAPYEDAVMVPVGRELRGACGAFIERLGAVALQHKGGCAPDINLGYHRKTLPRPGSLQRSLKIPDAEKRLTVVVDMPPILTAEDVVKRIAAGCAFVDERARSVFGSNRRQRSSANTASNPARRPAASKAGRRNPLPCSKPRCAAV